MFCEWRFRGEAVFGGRRFWEAAFAVGGGYLSGGVLGGGALVGGAREGGGLVGGVATVGLRRPETKHCFRRPPTYEFEELVLPPAAEQLLADAAEQAGQHQLRGGRARAGAGARLRGWGRGGFGEGVAEWWARRRKAAACGEATPTHVDYDQPLQKRKRKHQDNQEGKTRSEAGTADTRKRRAGGAPC